MARDRPPEAQASPRIRVLVAGIVGWTAVGVVVIIATSPPDLLALAVFLTAICAAVAILAPFAGAEPAIVVAVGGAQAVAAFALTASDARGTVAAGAGVAIAGAGAVGLAQLIGRRLSDVDNRLDSDREIIAELSQRDGVTGALKRAHADRLLREELNRSRRYQSTFCLMIVGVDDWAALVELESLRTAHERLRTVSTVVQRFVRAEDRLARHGEAEFSLIMPETPILGAETLANRLLPEVLAETSVGVRAGIANFPDDAVDPDALISEAESALDFARAAGVGVASSRLLRS